MIKNAIAISSLSRQLIKICETIDSVSLGSSEAGNGYAEIESVYSDILADELEHLQVLTLSLTGLVVDALPPTFSNEREDEGSVFMEGDLTEEKPVDSNPDK